jgi:hypothetical protein
MSVRRSLQSSSRIVPALRGGTISSLWIAIGAALAIGLCLPRTAFAAAGDTAKAEAMFLDGKQRMAREDYTGACPLFAESFRLDAATGTLLALAICHERAGKLASAYREYNEALARSKQEARADREHAAREHSTALGARLSSLTLSNSQVSQLTGLEVRVDGLVIDPNMFGKPIPIDGGEHVVEAWAPGKKTWRTTLTIAASIDARTVIVPQLENEPRKVAAPIARAAATQRRAPAPRRDAPEPKPRASTPWLGIVAVSTGLVGLGVGGYFTLRALSKNQDSNAGCEGDVCTPEGRRDRIDARHAGNAATIAFAAGGALAVTGFILVIAGGPSESDSRRSLNAGAWFVPGSAGATLHGSF